ncbi:MAG: preprotein translocase subunit YajC [Lentisphaerae bacterium GWF2_44_16]|nr:MAG: preprotein translocase subunit YajC [Lentisphaerae bacterium GWF2_44_16]
MIVVAQAAGGAPAAGGSMLGILGPILIFGVMIFFLFRTQRKEAKRRQAMLEAIKVGDKVVTGGGIYGIVATVKEKSYIVKIADNVKVEITKTGVSTVVTEETPAAVEEEKGSRKLPKYDKKDTE